MLRLLVCFLSITAALAQSQQLMSFGAGNRDDTPDPVDAAIQAVWQARRDGAPVDPAQREEARQALAEAPISSPQYAAWAETIAQFYTSPVQSRAVLEEALGRVEPLGKNSATRMNLLNALSDSWQQDRNLLQALACAEQAALIHPPAAPVSQGARFIAINGAIRSDGNNSYAYRRLAELYRELGRPQDVETLIARIAASGASDPFLASLYEREGRMEDAAKVYQRQVDGASDPQQSIGALQMLSGFDARNQHFSDAIAALQKAIDTAAALPSTGMPNQSFWLRQDMARLLQQAGRTDDADALYQQLLAQSQSLPAVNTQMLFSYANYLGSTNRAAQAQSILENFLNSGSSLEPWEQSNALFNLANLAQQSGNSDRAEQYRKRANDIQRSQNPMPNSPVPGLTISGKLTEAFTAANAGKFDDALTLALEAIGAAPSARDRATLVSQASNLAITMAHKAPDAAQEIFDRLFAAVPAWDDGSSLEPLHQNYVRMLLNQRRWPEASRALEDYRDVLIADRGPGTGWLDQYYRMKIELAQTQGAKSDAATAAEEFLKYEATLNGDTSDPYLSALELAAPTIERSGSTGRALDLYRRSIAVIDLVTSPGDIRRASLRGNAALALARAGQFDDAEALARQAVAISGTTAWQLQQVLKLKAEAAKSQAQSQSQP